MTTQTVQETTLNNSSIELPAINLATIWSIVIAGAVALAAFDLFGQVVSPMLGFAKLAPVPLATQTWAIVFGESYAPGGHLLHYIAGVIAYPVGWAFIWQPLAKRFLPPMHWFASATLYGIGLWVFALYVMAHLVAGNPPFLGFGGITWVALVGHVIFAWVAAAILVKRLPQA